MRARGDLEGVVRTLAPWAEKYPDRTEVQQALGLAYYQQDNFAGAIRHLSVALKGEPENSPPWKQTVETPMTYVYAGDRGKASGAY